MLLVGDATERNSLLTKKRKLDNSDFRTSGGFADNCRICNAEIFRKGQSRPRICLGCEKKKATPITDVCKDCHEPIIRSNVRKARICYDCKKNRDRSKTDSLLCTSPTTFCSTLPPSLVAARRLQIAQRRLDFVAQLENMSIVLQQNGLPTVGITDEPFDTASKKPVLSGLSKVNTAYFSTPESLANYLAQKLRRGDQTLLTSAVPASASVQSVPAVVPENPTNDSIGHEADPDTPILVPMTTLVDLTTPDQFEAPLPSNEDTLDDSVCLDIEALPDNSVEHVKKGDPENGCGSVKTEPSFRPTDPWADLAMSKVFNTLGNNVTGGAMWETSQDEDFLERTALKSLQHLAITQTP